LFIVVSVGSGTYAAEGDIGDFDIEKVRTAAQRNDTGLGEARVPAADRENVTALVFRITLYLGIVIILIVGIAWFVRRTGLKHLRTGGGGAMDVVETLSVGQNRMLLMVRVMDEIYLLSQTASAITLIDKIGGQKAVDIIASSKGGGTILHFKDAFNNFMGKIKKPA
jgi:flagellar biosynthetic protein FliO